MRRNHPPIFFPLLFLIVLFSGCTEAPPAAPPIPSPEALEQKIVSLLEMPTFEQSYREVIYLGEQKSFLILKTRDFRVLFALDLQVEAGIDLTEPWEIRTSGWQEVIVTLPEPKVLSVDADESTIHQYFIKEWGLGEGFGRLDLYDEINHAKDRIRDEAVRRGILLSARNNAETMVKQLFLLMGFESVVVRTGGLNG